MLQKLLSWFTGTKLWQGMMNVLPYIRFSTYYTRFSGDHFKIASSIMTPGQFIVCLDEHKLSTMVIPGFMSHADYVKDNSKYSNSTDYEIGEMTKKGYTKSFLFDICKEADRIVICDCTDWHLAHKEKMIKALSYMENKTYDVRFKFGVDSLYCSELVYMLDLAASNPIIPIKELAGQNLKGKMQVDLSDIAGLGQQYISPDGLLFAKNTRIVWDSDGELTGMLGHEAEKYCKEKGYIK